MQLEAAQKKHEVNHTTLKTKLETATKTIEMIKSKEAKQGPRLRALESSATSIKDDVTSLWGKIDDTAASLDAALYKLEPAVESLQQFGDRKHEVELRKEKDMRALEARIKTLESEKTDMGAQQKALIGRVAELEKAKATTDAALKDIGQILEHVVNRE
jgi:chromosome segregation ATPase